MADHVPLCSALCPEVRPEHAVSCGLCAQVLAADVCERNDTSTAVSAHWACWTVSACELMDV